MPDFIYLASQSPRRAQLLEQLGVSHALLLADAHEDAEALEAVLPHEAPAAYVQRVTALKLDYMDLLKNTQVSSSAKLAAMTTDQADVVWANRDKDATVYAIWGAGNRDRLGLVVGNTTQTFTAPYKAGDFRVEVDFIAGDDIVTENMGVTHGDHIQVVIPPGR